MFARTGCSVACSSNRIQAKHTNSVEQLKQMAESGSARSRKQNYLVTLQILQEHIPTGINQEMT